MTHPTILIGLGTSGMKVIEQVQRFHYEVFKTNKPQNVEYLYLETNKSASIGVTALKNQVKNIHISLGQMETMMNNLQSNGNNDWLGNSEALVNDGMGAGGIRTAGRLALWGSNDDGDNFVNVLSSFETAFRNATQNSEEHRPTVFIVGSTAGGTGSGIFIDIAYLIRHVIKDIKEIFALLLIPGRPKTLVSHEVMYANTYAALRDLHYYNQSDTVYEEHWPNGITVKFKEPPYELTQIVTQDYNVGSAPIKNLSGLYKLSGMYLFLNMIGMRDKRMERLVDAKGNRHISKYGTFGISAIQYPKDQIQEYLAATKSIELLESWMDSRFYYKNDSKQPINPTLIEQEVDDKWDGFLKQAFDVLDNAGGNEITQMIEEESVSISKNQQGTRKEKYIQNLFKSQHTNQYYGMVKNNTSTARNKLVELIYDDFSRVLDQTENLGYAIIYLRKLSMAIRKTLDYWNKSLRVDSEPAKWDKLLMRYTKWMLNDGVILPRFKEVGEQQRVLNDRMLSTLEIMKMHLLEPILNQIGRNIKIGTEEFRSTRQTSKHLPRITKLEEIIDNIRETVGQKLNKADSDDKHINLNKRLLQVKADVEDDSIPILRVYKSGEFMDEVYTASNLYQQALNNQKPTKKILIGEKPLWEYFLSIENDFTRILYRDAIQKHGEKIAEVNCVTDYDVAQFISQHPNEGKRMARKALAALIRVQKDVVFKRSQYIPRFVVGSDKEKLESILDVLEKRLNFSDFPNSPDGILELPNLKNMMVFYDEKGTIVPLVDIEYINQMEENYSNPPSHLKEMTKEKWINDRVAYKTDLFQPQTSKSQ